MAKTPAKKKVAKKKKSAKKSASGHWRLRDQGKVSTPGAFVASINVNEQTFKGAGATALEAFDNVKVPTMMLKTRTVLTLEHDGKKSEQIFFAIQLRRFTLSKISREIWAKRMESRLQ